MKCLSCGYSKHVEICHIIGISEHDDNTPISQINDFKNMITLCPTKCYAEENDKVMILHEGCIECGTCAQETDWKHPRGEKGIHYKYG